MGRVDGKIALVTGGSSGIGKATVEMMAVEGATVYLADINDDQGIAIAGANSATFIHLDVSQADQWQSAMALIQADHGRLDILVNNAGISPHDNYESLDMALWHHIMAIVLEGPALGVNAALPLLKQSQAGSIVNLSSVAGIIGASGYASYGAAKAGVRNLTKSVAMLCTERKYPIRCNSVHPGSIDTPILDADKAKYGDKAISQREKSIPMGRLGRAQEVANAIFFLACDESSFITGTELIVDGGFTAR